MYSPPTVLHKIHIRNLFKIFIPLRAENNFQIKINTTPVFGVSVFDKNDPNISYDYHVQMLVRERSYPQGTEVESEVVGCFSWAKRNAVLFQTTQPSNQLDGLVLRVKVNHGVFDFRKTSRQLVRIVVNLRSEDRFIRQGTSDYCKVFPKKRKADRTSENTEAEIEISWPDEQQTSAIQQPYSMLSAINIDRHMESPLEVYESPEVHQITNRLPNLFDQSTGIHEVELSTIYPMPANQVNDEYMVLYNGNAEVVGNFRALNFYKASDINIKEDIRLLVDNDDPRDVIMHIDGVSYKFKPGTTHSTNKRFVGYIAQQIESVVPEAVQLIDGILHVDYESLIPYLSESIKQNFSDIQGLKSDTKKLEALLDKLYEQFTRAPVHSNDNDVTSNVSTQYEQRWKTGAEASTGLVRTKWKWLIGLLLLAVLGTAVALAVGLVFKSGGPNEMNPTAPHQGNPHSVARSALIEFYEAMEGDYWKVKTNWLSDRSVCDWHGVTCEGLLEKESVTEIHLSNNNLKGMLIGLELMSKLGKLRVLDLSQNGIYSIVKQLPEYLTHLNLSNNRLGADIKAFNQIKYIESLNLADNWITGEFQLYPSQLVRLRELNISRTYISSIGPIEGEYNIEVCDWTGVTVGCPIPEWIIKCGATCV